MKPKELRDEVCRQLGLGKESTRADERLEKLREDVGQRARDIMARASGDDILQDTIQLTPNIILRRRVLHLTVPNDDILVAMIEAGEYVEAESAVVSQTITLGIHDLERSDGTILRPAASVDIVTVVSADYPSGDYRDQVAVLERANPSYPVLYPDSEASQYGTGRITHGPSLSDDLDLYLTAAEIEHAADRLRRDPAATFEGMQAALDQLDSVIPQTQHVAS